MDELKNKKVILSGIQPTGIPTLGNYLGAMRNWQKLQKDFNCLYFIANLHSITVRQEKKLLEERTFSLIALLLACGIDEEKSTLFVQSQISEHAELSWILQCNTQFGDLTRMTQFKDKSAKNSSNINAGLFCYPTLMAADILLYDAGLVPVGVDQTQHVEIARNIANRFNKLYGETFKLPKAYIVKDAAKIKSLSNPEVKMSKSDKNLNGFISVLDEPETIVKKFKRAVTDSGSKIVFKEDKPGISNLIVIYAALSNLSIEQVEQKFAASNYGDFKLKVAELVVESLKPIQKKYKELMKNRDYLEKVCNNGLEKASKIAKKKLKDVYEKVGLLR